MFRNYVQSRVRVLASLTVLLTLATSVSRASDAEFEQIANDYWNDAMERDPLLATRAGDHRYNDRLPLVGLKTLADHDRVLNAFLVRLDQTDPESLSESNRINYEILRLTIENGVAESKFDMTLIPITNRSGFHIDFPDIRTTVPLDTAADVRNYIARLAAFESYAAGHIELLREGIRKNMTLPSVVLESYRTPIEAHLVSNVDESVFFEPFKDLSGRISEHEQEDLIEQARQAIRDGILPGYQQFLKFMTEEYVPAARGSLGASALPRGREIYRQRVKRFTTLDITPDEVHQLGLKEVERIRNEMLQVIDRVGFDGNVPQFAESIRSDTRFHAKSPEELMEKTAIILKRIDGRLPKLFNKLPRTPYGLKEIPAYIAPQTTTAYYMPPAGDGTEAGFYFLNTYDLKSRPLYELESLSLHEAVPGHHLQIALQFELENVPPYRRQALTTVFVEGWALYAERLGLEVGFYEDPYSDFGRLTYEMWRACRLVVDTGIHYFGWSREQAIEFMANNTALSLHNIRAEVDRYISWPGQALAYKIGELKIRELRRMAEQHLGNDFDIREFHDVVLENGAIPLTTLERHVRTRLMK